MGFPPYSSVSKFPLKISPLLACETHFVLALHYTTLTDCGTATTEKAGACAVSASIVGPIPDPAYLESKKARQMRVSPGTRQPIEKWGARISEQLGRFSSAVAPSPEGTAFLWIGHAAYSLSTLR